MLRWAFAFLIIALIAGVLGFGRMAEGASNFARICFIFFIAGFLFSLIWGLVKRRKDPPGL